MPEPRPSNPAEIAAEKALSEMFECIGAHQNFRLEAGAGAGKTYSLEKALRFIIRKDGHTLQRRSQQIACITYTNVATDEIVSITDEHPAVHASTIHAFCWNLIKGFQPNLRVKVPEIKAWAEKLEVAGGIGTRVVDYDLGHRRVSDSHLSLHHDDVLVLTVELMELKKFRRILANRFPILFIDEYQDTNAAFADSILRHFIAQQTGPLIGLFGDSWQKIYGDGCGLIENENLNHIGKEANFRSVKCIVDVLNRLRPDLPQEVENPAEKGSVVVCHSNDWAGERRTGSHWKGDLLSEDAHKYLQAMRQRLSGEGWNFSPTKTKILMLTHNVLAMEQDYAQIASTFCYKESFVKKEDPHIEFLVDIVEPACEAFVDGRFGEMLELVGSRNESIQSIQDKKRWAAEMRALVKLGQTGTIGEIIDRLKVTHRPRLPGVVRRTETKLAGSSSEEIAEDLNLSQISKLREIPYNEIKSLALFVSDHTPFSTKHGVKGAQFENVLVVLGRGWNHYNWNQFLEWFPNRVPSGKRAFYERNRNFKNIRPYEHS